MITASISNAKNRLSALIKEVQGGEPIVITDRGVPVAKLVPIAFGTGVPARVLGLAQQGLAQLPEQTPDAAWLDLPWPTVRPGPSSADLLIAERRAST